MNEEQIEFPSSQDIVDNAMAVVSEIIDNDLAGQVVGALCENGMLTGYMTPAEEKDFEEVWPTMQTRTKLRDEIFNLAVTLRRTTGILNRTGIMGEMFTKVDEYRKLEES